MNIEQALGDIGERIEDPRDIVDDSPPPVAPVRHKPHEEPPNRPFLVVPESSTHSEDSMRRYISEDLGIPFENVFFQEDSPRKLIDFAERNNNPNGSIRIFPNRDPETGKINGYASETKTPFGALIREIEVLQGS